MKINKNQALYRGLPFCWTTYSDSNSSDYKYACEITEWITKDVKGINEEMIKKDIHRKVESFKIAGGIVKEEFNGNAINNFKFVEPFLGENIPNIFCKINPNTYYCQQCGFVRYEASLKNVRCTYYDLAKVQLRNRNLDLSVEDCLLDSISTCKLIITEGKFGGLKE